MTKNNAIKVFVLSIVIFVCYVCVCFFNFRVLTSPLFQKKTVFSEVAFVKYEKDGNLYVVDSGFLRLVCMTPQGHIKYIVSIDKTRDYTKIFDIAVDEDGNLYAHTMKSAYNE
ncbi:MAG: hypothetical protein LBE74_10175, partial [Treponema sp.]|nr:hypothetical protein [Treponema sp.]